MRSAPPVANLLVIRSPDIDRAVTFYQQMGMRFIRHAHGNGPEHFASETDGFVFEIYPQRRAGDDTTSTRIGFSVEDVDGVVSALRDAGATVVSEPANTAWGRRAVVKDLDGHVVELSTPPSRGSRGADS